DYYCQVYDSSGYFIF
nr:immunoglobulin light chain junction region [Macaca mulatta]MOY06575.1 immunoglobulin light chain junction region [Macaca mulatta]